MKVDFVGLCDLVFPGFNKLLNENNYILSLEIFKKYYHPNLVLNKNQSEFVTEIDELAKIAISPRPSNEYSQLAVDALILITKTHLVQL